MNWNQIESNWNEFKSNIQQQWNELTGDDLDNMSGNREELIEKIQQTYGFDRQHAENEVDRWETSQHDNEENNQSSNNTIFNNKFGYDETSSNQVQSGHDNRDMPGTNNLKADSFQNINSNKPIGVNTLPSDGFSSNYDEPSTNDNGNESSGIKGTITRNNIGANKTAEIVDESPNEYDPLSDKFNNDEIGISGANEENEMGENEEDEFKIPNPNPMPDDFNNTNHSGGLGDNTGTSRTYNETPHQDKSIDQT